MGSLEIQPPSGLVRNITEVFLFLRGNAQQSRGMHTEFSVDNDRTALIVIDEEQGSGAYAKTPPSWVTVLDEILYEMTRIKSRKTLLKDLQQKHVLRPDFSDDSSFSEQTKIEEMTEEVTTMFAHCRRLARLMEEAPPDSSTLERLRENAMSAQLLSLNGLFHEFRASQSQYLKQLDARKHNVNSFLLASDVQDNTTDRLFSTNDEGELTMDVIQQIVDNDSLVREREEEVVKISKSIVELNTVFKDVATLVLDQGTILDRIDYNVEQSVLRIKSSCKSIQKADKYQGNNKKMRFILILAGIALFLTFLLLLKKF
jgi:syntaxin 16